MLALPRPGVTGSLNPFCPPVYLCTTGPRGLMGLLSPEVRKQVAQMPMWRQSRQGLPEAS